MNDYEKAIETMCSRCINHEMCQGTGCTPKNYLVVLKENYDRQLDDYIKQHSELQKYKYALDKACELIKEAVSKDCTIFDEVTLDNLCWIIERGELKEWCLKDEDE